MGNQDSSSGSDHDGHDGDHDGDDDDGDGEDGHDGHDGDHDGGHDGDDDDIIGLYVGDSKDENYDNRGKIWNQIICTQTSLKLQKQQQMYKMLEKIILQTCKWGQHWSRPSPEDWNHTLHITIRDVNSERQIPFWPSLSLFGDTVFYQWKCPESTDFN